MTQAPQTDAARKTFRNLPTFRLHMLAGRSERYSEAIYRKKFDLNLPECRVIGITGGYGTVTFKRICREVHLEKSYASRIINRLVDRGYIDKIDNPADQRSVILALTEEGLRVHGELHAIAMALNTQLLAVLTPEQIRSFTSCLLLLTDRIDEMEQGTAGTPAPSPASISSSDSQDVRVDRATAQRLHQLLGELLSRHDR